VPDDANGIAHGDLFVAEADVRLAALRLHDDGPAVFAFVRFRGRASTQDQSNKPKHGH